MIPPEIPAVEIDVFLAAGRSMPPPLAALHRLWTQKRGTRPAPARADFDIFELRPWLGYLTLIDVVDGGRDYFYRVSGTSVTAFYDNDLTGRYLSEVEPGIREVVEPEYRRVIANARPLFVVRRPRVRRESARVARCILPLASGGTAVDQIFIGFHALGEDD